MSRWFLLIFFLYYLIKNCSTNTTTANDERNKTELKETVLIKPYADVKYFDLPTSDEPLVSWMDVQKGIFPNTTKIKSRLDVGESISIFIYLRDMSNLYDIKVTDCWAYDNKNFIQAKNLLHLTENKAKNKTKLIKDWHKYKLAKDNLNQIVLYTDLIAFKFPDQDQIYIKCDIELCFKSCEHLLKPAKSHSL